MRKQKRVHGGCVGESATGGERESIGFKRTRDAGDHAFAVAPVVHSSSDLTHARIGSRWHHVPSHRKRRVMHSPPAGMGVRPRLQPTTRLDGTRRPVLTLLDRTRTRALALEDLHSVRGTRGTRTR